MPYIANTAEDRREMLAAIGCADLDEMWSQCLVDSPAPDLNLADGLSESEVIGKLRRLAGKNAVGLINFLGGGYYDHLIPAAVDDLSGRSEFLTAYTPYQPEASQGTLQAIYEYQSLIARLTGMAAANASLYDGGTALFEAMMLAVRSTRRRQAVISKAVSPIFRRMIQCYSSNLDVELIEVDCGLDDSAPEALLAAVTERTACVIVQYPNFFGTVEKWDDFVRIVHERKALAICSCYPMALALLRTPGEMGFDVVTGEGQSLGIPLSFGGPYLGFMAVTANYLRKMPGRIVGRTTDAQGRDGFVLTLQTREQHIRRDQATSNICSNENLCALRALIYLSCLGKEGLIHAAELCAAKAVFACETLTAIRGVGLVGRGAFFNEFVLELPVDAAEVVGSLIDKGFAAGFPLGRYYEDRRRQLLVAVTEKRTREEIKNFANALEAVLWS
ncbi:aminomethyl-transferring glycine dehydrogenase subunit GcvPA [Victivallis sp. Marseille-Q1083]|uniref:aminomethyl-transferring glycine dehydrogenase subunit GcvPA n=1 Tax=Victivallis sp. Marseille-Q1083 TaxID=2717288 RepID=UPI00158E6E75|nr:aminomethyl-transferring glycine dehydrogenase subunit GcvPA [Victivallis sp. Marseille-Q1083]